MEPFWELRVRPKKSIHAAIISRTSPSLHPPCERTWAKADARHLAQSTSLPHLDSTGWAPEQWLRDATRCYNYANTPTANPAYQISNVRQKHLAAQPCRNGSKNLANSLAVSSDSAAVRSVYCTIVNKSTVSLGEEKKRKEAVILTSTMHWASFQQFLFLDTTFVS